MKTTNAQLDWVQITSTEFHPDHTLNVKNKDRSLFMPFSKVRMPLSHFFNNPYTCSLVFLKPVS